MARLMRLRAPKPNVKVEIMVGGRCFELTYRRMKSIRIVVHGPDGRVTLSAPHHTTDKAIHAFIQARNQWLEDAIAVIRKRAESAPQPLVTPITDGSILHILGTEIHVGVVRGFTRRGAVQDGNRLLLKVRDTDGVDELTMLVDRWKRDVLKEAVGGLVARYEPMMGVRVNEIGIKKMTTRWGTCAILAKRIWINHALVSFPFACVEAVVVHELVHLLERNHTTRFYMLMTHFLPQWRESDRALACGIPRFC